MGRLVVDAQPFPNLVVEWLPTTRKLTRYSMPPAIHGALCSLWHHLFSFAVQFSTTVIGTISIGFVCEMIKNRWPSRLTQ